MSTTDPFAASGGGIMVNGGWIPNSMVTNWGSNTTQGGGSSSGSGGSASGGFSTMNFTPSAAPGFTGPAWNAAPAWKAPGAFTYQQFQAPDQQAVLADPGYQFRLQQGQRALDQSAAAKGMLRGGAQARALTEYGQQLGSQEYQQAYARAMDTYRQNYQTAKDTYTTGYQSDIDAWKAAVGERDAAWNARFKTAEAEYQPSLLSWQAQNLAGQRNAEMNFGREWDRYTYDKDDAWRREALDRDYDWRNRTYAGDDAFRWENMREARRQFLASLGKPAE